MKKCTAFILLFLVTACMSEKYVGLVKEIIPKTVHFTVLGDEEEIVIGSGVYISPKGYILTCAHLFNHFKKIRVILVTDYKDNVYAGTLVKISSNVDLALVQCTFLKNVPFARLADPSKLKIGQEVLAIGHPHNLDWSVTHGIISALYRDLPLGYNVTQTDAAINPGNSGGPLFNLNGEIVGINSFIFTGAEGLAFSVQSGQCLEFLTGVKELQPVIRDTMRRFDTVTLAVRYIQTGVIVWVLVWLVVMFTYFRGS